MTDRAVVDTSVFVALETGRVIDRGSLPSENAVTPVTLGELHWAIQAASTPDRRSARLATLQFASRFRLLSPGFDAARHWGQLRESLRSSSQVRVNDLWIAAIAMEYRLPVCTQDRGFFAIRDAGGPDVILV